MAAILTLDLGTTFFKAALFGHDGRLLALERQSTPIAHPRPGEWEIAAEQFRATLRDILAALRTKAPDDYAAVQAVSFATQSNSFVLLDAADQPLTPIILWPDKRAKEFDNAAAAVSATEDFREVTGVPRLTYEFMAAKLLWLRHHQPEAWAHARRLCLISDYLTLWLTGRHVSEGGAAGLTGLLDIHAMQWRSETCDALDLPLEWLMHPTRAGTDVGTITPSAAQELGLPTKCRFVVGCLDQYAGPIGVGNIHHDGLSETTGTVLAGVRCVHRREKHVGDEVYQGPGFDEGTYYQMCFCSCSANLLNWYCSKLVNAPTHAALDELAAAVPPGADRLIAKADAVNAVAIADGFLHTNSSHTTGHFVRAILERVAFALADQIDRLCGDNRPRQIHSSGGASRSDAWLQIKADVLGIPVVAIDCPEPTSLGAAMLAARASGWGSLKELACAWIRPRNTFLPNTTHHDFYRTLRPTRLQ